MEASAPALLGDETDALRRRAMIGNLAEFMKALPDEVQHSLEPINHFGGGVYARELRIAAGNILVGMIHKHENMLVLMQGDATIYTETGSFRVQAPKITTAPAGTQRVGYCHTDCIFVSFLAVGAERDVAVIEREFVTADWNDPALAGLQVARPLILAEE